MMLSFISLFINLFLLDHLPALAPLLLITTELTTALVLVLFVLLFVSFCASGAEVAFFSLTYKDINYLKTKSQPGYKRIITLLESPKTLLGSLMMANSIANIGVIIISNFLIDKYLNLENPWWLLAIKVMLIAGHFVGGRNIAKVICSAKQYPLCKRPELDGGGIAPAV